MVKCVLKMMPKVNREYKKLFRLYKRVDIERDIILISDSKGLTIKKT
jgi:hypothetical protein